MRPLLLAAALALLAPLPALARSDISREIGEAGLTVTEARLAALAAPDDAERFALGGVRFLRGIERTLQARWRAGLNRHFSELPVLRLPLEPNPAPEPFTPGLIAEIFTGLSADMAAAREPLAAIPDASDFGLEIALSDLWFDVDADGARAPEEDLLAVAGTALLGRRAFATEAVPLAAVIRFDAADAAWLSAYAHFLSAVSEAVLAYDPTGAIARSQETAAGLAALNGTGRMENALDMQFGFYLDRIAIVKDALAQEPDAARAAAAHGHLLSMIAENRRFWRLAAAETDDAAEWLPNDAQRAALGIEVPQGLGETWLSVLEDGEALLKGEKLVPYWRLDSGAGLNLGRMFLEPRPVDILDWVQGAGALPYAERGPRVSAESWRAFEALVQGDAMLFVLFVN